MRRDDEDTLGVVLELSASESLCARGSGGNLRFGPKCAASVSGNVSLLLFGSAPETFAFELGRSDFSCTDNERVDGTLCHQRRVLLRG